MENLMVEFISQYGVTILYTVITAIAGYIGIFIKGLVEKYINDSTKRAVAKTCVEAIEQIYKNLHGEDKLNKCLEAMSEMLMEKGITVTSLEMRMLIEAAVLEFNKHAKVEE
jgi:intergrase/recombinase